MPRRPATITQADVARIIRAVPPPDRGLKRHVVKGERSDAVVRARYHFGVFS
jgi:hypothetical protein